MAKRDVVDDLTDIVHPWPSVADSDADELQADAVSAWCEQVEAARREFEHSLRLPWEEGDVDPLLGLLAEARREMRAAEKRMRLLVAYGREFVEPRPYRLEDLAQATGMSISGTRTAYDDDEIAEVGRLTGRRRRTRPTGNAS